MKNNNLTGNILTEKVPNKHFLWIMRTTFILLFTCVFCSMAEIGYTQNIRVTINKRNVTLREVLNEIEKQTDYLFIYNNEVNANEKVSIRVKQKAVSSVLNALLEDKNLNYSMEGNHILLSTEEKKENVSEEIISILVQQQKKQITGRVVDESGEPVIGVNIVEVGTSNGTVTDVNGRFSFRVDNNATIRISYIGYLEQDISTSNQQDFNIILLEDTQALDELVVVGYGTQKKSDLTGSVSSITPKAFIDQPMSSANSILAGKAPGVTVRKMNGAPGQGSTIRIRGANSIYGGNDPLIVVDGNYSSMPDMYDIESIEILKDASATAIYGSRGANGVILVTTKRGAEGKPTLRLYSDFSFDEVTQRYDLMNANEFAQYNNEVGSYPFTADELAYYKANSKGTDWQDAIFRTALSQNYKVVLTGGTKNVRYYVSPSYNKREGTLMNSQSSGYGLSSKVDADLSDRVTVQVEANVSHSDILNDNFSSGGSKTSNAIMSAIVWSPTEPVYEEDGSYNSLGIGTGTILSPVLLTTVERRPYSNNGSGVGNIRIKIIDGLEFNAKGSVSFGTGGLRLFESKIYNNGVNALAEQQSYESKSWLVNAFLTYNKTFAETHHFSAMAGFEETKNKYEWFEADADALPNESVKWYNLGMASPNIGVGSSFSNTALRSFFGRVNYNYDSRYYFTANFRADGSSKFRNDNKFGYFPSFALAWRLSEEGFMKDQNVFQNIKIRGGWGATGNQAVDAYATYATLSSRGYAWGSAMQAGYLAQIGGNPDLKWETTKQMNLGLDLSFLNNRIAVSLDYYNKKTEDLLAPMAVPAYNGGVQEYGKNAIITNIGSVRNEGFEFSINYNVVETKNFMYEVNFNGAFNRNEVLDLGGESIVYGETYASGLGSASPFVLMPGQPIGAIYGLKYLGIWQQNEAEEAAKYQQTPGDYKYEDLNGNYSYDTGDKQIIGNANPKFTWGLNNHFSYKNWGLNILIEGVHGRDILNWSYMIANERIDFSQIYTSREARNRWTESNTGAKFAKIGNTNKLNPLSSQYMEDASYVKLRNISLSYRFPRKIISFADIRFSVSAQNLLTISSYKGYDPEISSTIGDDANSGMDWFAYPNPRSFSFGISLTY